MHVSYILFQSCSSNNLRKIGTVFFAGSNVCWSSYRLHTLNKKSRYWVNLWHTISHALFWSYDLFRRFSHWRKHYSAVSPYKWIKNPVLSSAEKLIDIFFSITFRNAFMVLNCYSLQIFRFEWDKKYKVSGENWNLVENASIRQWFTFT